MSNLLNMVESRRVVLKNEGGRNCNDLSLPNSVVSKNEVGGIVIELSLSQ